MSLAEILKKNAMLVGEAGSRKRRKRKSPRLLVISCCCADVTRMLEPALDLDSGEACVIRTAGAWGGRAGDEILRSAVLALHQTGCREILVVGHDGCAYTPASRARVRESMKSSGVLTGFTERREGMLESIRGPSSPEAGVIEVVRMLRSSEAVPDECAVHGCMLDTDTFAIRVIDQDRATGEPPVEAAASSGIGLVPLPELPDIPLPEIPKFDLDALTAPTETQPTGISISEYGKDTGTGPVSFSQLQKMPESMAFMSDSHLTSAPAPISTGIGFKMPDIIIEVPKGVKIQDTGLDIPQILPDEISDLEALQSVEAKKRVRAKASTQRRASVTAQESVQAKKSIRKRHKIPERPRETPTVHATPQRPLGEQLITFEKKPQQDQRSVRVDLPRGFVGVRGSDMPLAPDLQRALLKVQQFLASQFSAQDRSRIIERVRRGSQSGTPFGELLKMMIAPVLKLGKKRYAVINDLLKIKEDLPRQDPEVSVALLMEILGG